MNKRAVFLNKPPFVQFAQFLKLEHGWDVFGFSVGSRPGPMSNIFSGYLDLYDVIQRAKTSPIPDDIIARCQRMEDEYDVNLADVISADRHLGIAWITGGLYPRSRLSYLPYERHLHIIHEVFEALHDFLRRVEPAFVCAGTVGSFMGAIISFLGDRWKIPILGLSSVARGRYYWHDDRPATIPSLEDAYRQLQPSPAGPANAEPWDTASFNSERARSVLTSRSLTRTFRRLFRIIYPLVIRKILRKEKKIGDAYISKSIAYTVRAYLNFRKDMRRSYTPFDELARSDYVYFPLTTEPEATLMGMEPHFTNQMYAIELLSKSVPVGVNVLVKEHWSQIGYRPANWLDTVADFPRVKLVHPFESSIEIIRQSLATATITGTAGMEAAIMGKPVISLGPNFRFNFVDHVYYSHDLHELREIISRICENRNSEELARNGAALKRAIEMTTFKCREIRTKLSDRYAGLVNPGPVDHELASSDLATACEELLKLVNVHQTAEPSSPTDGVANPSPFDA